MPQTTSNQEADSPLFGLLRIQCRDMCCRDAFERESVGQALLEATAEAS